MEESEHLVTTDDTLTVTEVDECTTDVDITVTEIQANCKLESEPSVKHTDYEIKLNQLSKKNADLDSENQTLRKDLKRKDKVIRVLIQKLRTNLESTRVTIDAIERQLLNEASFERNSCDEIETEAILPQDFLDFEMNQELLSDPSLQSESSLNLGEDDDEWSPNGSYKKLNKDGKYRCKWLGCGRLFSRNANLTRHYNTHLKNRSHQCQWTGCGKRFTDASSLKRHRRNHTGDKPYKCNWVGCDAQFGQASILAYHRKSHTTDRKNCRQSSTSEANHSTPTLNGPFVCDLIGCEKTFDNITNLKRHQAIHNGTRLYYCDWQGCDKNFLELSGLKRHRRIHTGERPYRCDWPGCGARYSQSSHLSTHIKSHKNERDYKCSLPDCSFAGVRMSDLRKHLRRKHKWQQSDFDEFEDAIDSSFAQNLIDSDLQSI